MQQEPEHQERQLIHTIHKGAKQQIQVSLAKYRGRVFGDIRLHVLGQQGDWIPTMKGCTVAVEQLDELERAIVSLRHAAERSTTLSESQRTAAPLGANPA